MPMINGSQIRKIVIAGDDSTGTVDRAGGTSTSVLVSHLRKQLAQHAITVEQAAVGALPTDADVIVAHRRLAVRVRNEAPTTVVVTVQVFAGDPAIKSIVAAVRDGVDLYG